MNQSQPQPNGIHKTKTGIPGLDKITKGGLPAGRPTLVCGGAGSGKTRIIQEAKDRIEAIRRRQTIDRRQLEFEHRRQTIATQISTLELELQAAEVNLANLIKQSELERTLEQQIASSRKSDAVSESDV